jgi:hypothetical protein
MLQTEHALMIVWKTFKTPSLLTPSTSLGVFMLAFPSYGRKYVVGLSKKTKANEMKSSANKQAVCL